MREPFQGTNALAGTILVAAPTPSSYVSWLNEQQRTSKAAEPVHKRLLEAARGLLDRAIAHLPVEIPFDDAGGDNPRNNSSAIIDALIDDRHLLLTADAGTPALKEALAYLWLQSDTRPWPFHAIQVPHHGSRHNLDSATLDLICGPIDGSELKRGIALASIAREAAGEYPRGRIANALLRRGFPVFTTAGNDLCDSGNGAPARVGWRPATALPPLSEDD